jgi:hypothetical protein
VTDAFYLHAFLVPLVVSVAGLLDVELTGGVRSSRRRQPHRPDDCPPELDGRSITT